MDHGVKHGSRPAIGLCLVGLLALIVAGCGGGSGNIGPNGPKCVASAASAPATPGDAIRGKMIFTNNSCRNCHTIHGISTSTVGPNLTHIGSCLTPSLIKAQIDNPQSSNLLSAPMPSGIVSGSDETDVIAYLSSLK